MTLEVRLLRETVCPLQNQESLLLAIRFGVSEQVTTAMLSKAIIAFKINKVVVKQMLQRARNKVSNLVRRFEHPPPPPSKTPSFTE
jgi:hypothetical protein